MIDVTGSLIFRCSYSIQELVNSYKKKNFF